jgi:predicted NAD-dependent protein-ADP-ribosyltransferase YbiA (DUF1768 family)
MTLNSIVYLFVPPWFTDADGDGVPDDYMEALLAVESPGTCKRLGSAISSFPAPDEYPE